MHQRVGKCRRVLFGQAVEPLEVGVEWRVRFVAQDVAQQIAGRPQTLAEITVRAQRLQAALERHEGPPVDLVVDHPHRGPVAPQRAADASRPGRWIGQVVEHPGAEDQVKSVFVARVDDVGLFETHPLRDADRFGNPLRIGQRGRRHVRADHFGSGEPQRHLWGLASAAARYPDTRVLGDSPCRGADGADSSGSAARTGRAEGDSVR